jgi:putative DNA-invertase from lambdoid prophage Rac
MTRRRKAAVQESPRTFGYTRVSTLMQASEGHSLDDQRARVTGYCVSQGLPAPSEFFVDTSSGTVPLQRRAAGSRMLAALRSGDHIVVTKGDRLFRSAKDALVVAEMLRDKGIELHLMDMGGPVLNSSVSRLVFGILMMVANMEAERIAERVSSVKDHLRRQQRYLGGVVPVGFVREGQTIKPSKNWAAHIETMKTLSDAGTSTRAIAAEMKQRGLRISHDTVHRCLVGARKTL